MDGCGRPRPGRWARASTCTPSISAATAAAECPSRDAALAYLRTARPRDQEASLRHRLEHNFVAAGAGVAVRYDKVRVALGLAHMADDLRKYAARATCPVAILRGTHTSELTL